VKLEARVLEGMVGLTYVTACGAFLSFLDDPQDAVVAQMYKNDL
jgi:hypothetical protein